VFSVAFIKIYRKSITSELQH